MCQIVPHKKDTNF